MSTPTRGDLIPFHFDGSPVRVVVVAGEPHFVGKDVAERLGYADPTTAIKSHCRGVQKLHPIQDAIGRTQQARILAEPDVLRLIVGSKLPTAQRFEAWVFEEVLPAIRKTGSYTAPGAPNTLTFRERLDAVQLAADLFGKAAALEVWNSTDGLPRILSAVVPADDARPMQGEMFAASGRKSAVGRPPSRAALAIRALRPGETVLLPAYPTANAVSALLTRERRNSRHWLTSHMETAGAA